MQEAVSFDPVQIDSVTSHSIVALMWVLPVGLAIFAFRSVAARFLKERSKRWKWTVLRWTVPSLRLCVDGITLGTLLFIRFDFDKHPIVLATLILLDLPGVLGAIAAAYVGWINIFIPAHWLGWYAVIVWMESIATKPISLREEIDRA